MYEFCFDLISNYVSYFPLVIFISLMLGGFNVPISEDVLVITCAVLCRHEKTHIPSFYAAIIFGAVLSDYLVYFWGWLLSKGVISFGLFSRIITQEKTKRISRALEKHGFLTYLLSRFIPFGVRNVVSMTSGFVNFKFYKFAVFDAFAAFCNTSVLFWLVYFFGSKGSFFMKIWGVVLFASVVAFSIYFIYSSRFFKLPEEESRLGNKDNPEKELG